MGYATMGYAVYYDGLKYTSDFESKTALVCRKVHLSLGADC